jgi:hypothetical protein
MITTRGSCPGDRPDAAAFKAVDEAAGTTSLDMQAGSAERVE